MTLDQIKSFFGGLLATGLAYLGILLFMFWGGFSFGGQTLTEKENGDAGVFFLALLVVSITTYAVIRRFKTNRKFSATGICIPLVFGLYFFILTAQTYLSDLSYREPFDKTIWSAQEAKPFNMAKTLVKRNTLIGQSQQEIIKQLGTPIESGEENKRTLFKYATDNGWEMRIYFKNDKVVETYLYEEGLVLSD